MQEAFVLERDRRAAEAVEEELRRLHELDRLHRQRNGAADTNLAALRDRVRARRGFVEERRVVLRRGLGCTLVGGGSMGSGMSE